MQTGKWQLIRVTFSIRFELHFTTYSTAHSTYIYSFIIHRKDSPTRR